MTIKKLFTEWVIPPGFVKLKNHFFNGLKTPSINSISLSSEDILIKTTNERLSNFKNTYGGKRCFILATGPSIKTQDLSMLKGEYCITVSMFHLHDAIDAINPIWHVLAPSHPPFQFDYAQKTFDSFVDRYQFNKQIQFLIGHYPYPYSYLNFLETNEKHQFHNLFGDKTFYMGFKESKQLDEDDFANELVWDISKKPFVSRTVIYSAIQLAHYLGFSEIVLVGCDHDYLGDINRVENHHFYAENKGLSDKEHLSMFDREKWFLEYYMRWKQYRLMKTYLNSKGVEIINATEGGMLDVFPRKKLETFFNK